MANKTGFMKKYEAFQKYKMFLTFSMNSVALYEKVLSFSNRRKLLIFQRLKSATISNIYTMATKSGLLKFRIFTIHGVSV